MRMSVLFAPGAREASLQLRVWSNRSYSANNVPPGPLGSSEDVPTSNTVQPQAQASAASGVTATAATIAANHNLRIKFPTHPNATTRCIGGLGRLFPTRQKKIR